MLQAYQDPHGIEQNFAFVKDPLMVNRLFLKKPERMEALGLVWWLSRWRWRLMERQRRAPVETTGPPLPGWDKTVTERPTAVMMMTTFAGVLRLTVGFQRQRARPLSARQPPDLVALRVTPTGFTIPAGEQRTGMAATRLSQLQKRLLRWLAADAQRPKGVIASRHQEVGCALQGDKGHISPRLRTLEAHPWIVIG